jgi:beta-galactosidase
VAERGGSVVATMLSGRVDEHDNAFLMDVPGPLGPLMGVRVDEWDAREADFVNPVRFGDGAVAQARLLFELVIPQGAETLATYEADFYAGTPAVTRNAFGAGFGWYVATALDAPGVAWVMRKVLEHHGLGGRYPGLESTTRVTPAGESLLFLLNHGREAVRAVAHADGVELLTGARVEAGAALTLEPAGVMVVRLEV